MRNSYKIVIVKSEGKRPIGRPRRGWKNSIKADIKGRGCMVLNRLMWLVRGSTGGVF